MDRGPHGHCGMRAPPVGSPAAPVRARGEHRARTTAARCGLKGLIMYLLSVGCADDHWGRHTRFVDGNLDLHGGAVSGVLGVLDERAVELADRLHGHILAEPVLGMLHSLVEGDMVESEHGVRESFGLGVVEVFEGHIDGVGFLSGLGVFIDADTKGSGEVDGLHADTLPFWAVADRNELPTFGVVADGVKVEEGRVEGGGFDDCFRVGHD
ncbi:hypothetical protein NADE_000266 [Nannochloris sp. 'desiccata']|nr:hypothetical protein KSW81_004951 [Chlorella desiccata (nom. nud.)]KAH7618065.1 hypothetical protein NADE_000266 [Chlorella desiccata (nom. nud.)]